ncbi:MAG: CopD family protein [Dehalococcoidia bacterium]
MAVVLVGWLSSAPGASAHAILVRADPAINGQLQSSPAIVTGFFSETVDQRLSNMEVFAGTGERVDNGELTFGPERERMAVGVDDELGPGFYTVVWETLSGVDGHLLRGSFPFTILNADGSQPSGPRFTAEGTGSTLKPQNVSVKWTQILFSTLLVGSLAFVALVANPAASVSSEPARAEARLAARRRALNTAWIAVGGLVLVAGGELFVQADQLGGLKYIDDVLSNNWGERFIQRQAVLVCIASVLVMVPAFARGNRERLADSATWVALAGGLGYLLLIAMVGHANAVPGSFWAVAADFLHLVATAVWVGMLVQLGLFLLWVRQEPDARSDLQTAHLERFSLIAATSVVVLLATGTINALVQVPSFNALVDTAYGRALLIKLGVVTTVLGVAGVNAFYLRERTIEEAEAPETGSRVRHWLRRAVWAEAALGIAVMLAAAILFQYPTSRQAEDAERAAEEASRTQAVVGYDEIQPAGDLTVNLTISPNAIGNNSFRVFLFPQQGGDIGDILRVRLRFVPPSGDAAPSEIDMEPAELTAYRAVGPFISEPGSWVVHVDIRRSGADDITADFPVAIDSPGGGGQFDLPLASGGWLTVGAIGLLVAALLLAAWSPRLPELPAPGPRLMRVGTAAFTVIGTGVIAISLLPGEAETIGNPIAADPQSIAMGRSLYTANCQQCHGPDGRGDGPVARDLETPPADFRIHLPYHKDEFFFHVISNGLTVMPSFGDRLTEDEIWHLINFLQSEFGIDAQEPGS